RPQPAVHPHGVLGHDGMLREAPASLPRGEVAHTVTTSRAGRRAGDRMCDLGGGRGAEAGAPRGVRRYIARATLRRSAHEPARTRTSAIATSTPSWGAMSTGPPPWRWISANAS